MADLSKIKLNGVEYDLKDTIAREAIENIPQIDGNKINKAWSIIEVDSGETTIVDIVPQQTINLTGDAETDLVNNVNFPREEIECVVSFDLYEGQTLIASVSKNITTPYGQNNRPSSFTFDNGNYEYNLNKTKKGFVITILNVTNRIKLGSPYRVVNFHIQKEEPLMIPTMGWNSQAVPIPTEEDNNKILRYSIKAGEPIWTDETIREPDTSSFMVKGTDYVTAGKKSGTTLGTKSTAEGNNTTASGSYAHAEGSNTIASNIDSHAEGSSTTASGNSSHVEGNNTTASGFASHAEGSNAKANGNYSHAEGQSSTASGDTSHAEGLYTIASGKFSHAEGNYTTAQRKSQHVFGEYNILDTAGTTTTKGRYVEIVGNGTNGANRSNARTLDWSGNEVLAGKLTIGTAPTTNMDVTTKQYVDSAITTAIGGINQFGVAIITDLPTTDIDAHTIYFKSNSSSGNNIYDEYMYINSNWELIGSTQIDLTPYALSANLATVATSGNYNDLTDTPNLATVATSGDYDDLTDAPVAETDANVEDMLDDFDLDYTSNTTGPNYANGVSF